MTTTDPAAAGESSPTGEAALDDIPDDPTADDAGTHSASTPDDDSADDTDRQPRRAEKYRQRAQEAEARIVEVEAESAKHVETIQRLQRLHVEQAVAATGIKPAAVFAVAELADLLNDDGLPDSDKVKAAIGAAQEQLGIGRATPPLRQLGPRSGSGTPPPKRDDWAAAFGPRNE